MSLLSRRLPCTSFSGGRAKDGISHGHVQTARRDVEIGYTRRMNFLKLKVWPVVAGFVVASIVMMAFEFTNSLFFPLPSDLDWMDTAAVQALTASLPWTAYILVLLGWIAGSFAGG